MQGQLAACIERNDAPRLPMAKPGGDYHNLVIGRRKILVWKWGNLVCRNSCRIGARSG